MQQPQQPPLPPPEQPQQYAQQQQQHHAAIGILSPADSRDEQMLTRILEEARTPLLKATTAAARLIRGNNQQHQQRMRHIRLLQEPAMYLEDATVTDDETLLDVDSNDNNGSRGGRPPRRRRNTMNPYQTRVLTRVFQYTQLPNTGLRERLGVALGMPARTVQVWFQNQRQKHKNKHVTPSGRPYCSPLTPATMSASASSAAAGMMAMPRTSFMMGDPSPSISCTDDDLGDMSGSELLTASRNSPARPAGGSVQLKPVPVRLSTPVMLSTPARSAQPMALQQPRSQPHSLQHHLQQQQQQHQQQQQLQLQQQQQQQQRQKLQLQPVLLAEPIPQPPRSLSQPGIPQSAIPAEHRQSQRGSLDSVTSSSWAFPANTDGGFQQAMPRSSLMTAGPVSQSISSPPVYPSMNPAVSGVRSLPYTHPYHQRHSIHSSSPQEYSTPLPTATRIQLPLPRPSSSLAGSPGTKATPTPTTVSTTTSSTLAHSVPSLPLPRPSRPLSAIISTSQASQYASLRIGAPSSADGSKPQPLNSWFEHSRSASSDELAYISRVGEIARERRQRNPALSSNGPVFTLPSLNSMLMTRPASPAPTPAPSSITTPNPTSSSSSAAAASFASGQNSTVETPSHSLARKVSGLGIGTSVVDPAPLSMYSARHPR